MKDNILDWE